MSVSATFGSWKDRLTYIAAEAPILVAGVLVSAAIALIWFKPEVPGVPPIVMGWTAALLLLGPPLFGFFVWGIHKLRRRNQVEVHHVDAVEDTLEKYYVDPEIWREKDVTGPAPYPVNGASAWAVQDIDWDDEMDTLRVEGVWLEETQDVKLLTDKSHMRAIYGKLTESHIALGILRDSASELGADIQRKLINDMAEARERGKLMDETAVKDVFESFESEATDLGADDLPTIEPEEDGADPFAPEPEMDGAGGPPETVAEAGNMAGTQAAATDGGEPHGE